MKINHNRKSRLVLSLVERAKCHLTFHEYAFVREALRISTLLNKIKNMIERQDATGAIK